MNEHKKNNYAIVVLLLLFILVGEMANAQHPKN